MRFRMLSLVLAVMCMCGPAYSAGVTPPEDLDVPYEPTPKPVVAEMLKAANVGSGDVLYDLGCGDGRIVVAAVKQFNAARGVGLDLDPQRIREADEEAAMAGVTNRVQFIQGDIMDGKYKDATVVTLYLLNEINLRVRPILLRQLAPGTRIIAHAFTMDDWEPDQTYHNELARNKVFYKWIVPARASGRWTWTTQIGQAQTAFALKLKQEFQIASGQMTVGDAQPVAIKSAKISGKEIAIDAELTMGGAQTVVHYKGTLEGDRITGKQTWDSGANAGTHDWVAVRQPVDPVGVWQLSVKPAVQTLADGKLSITRNEDGTLTARFGKADPGKPLWHFYEWGASLRFDVPVSEDVNITCIGAIEGDTMSGRALLPDSSDDEWTATRMAK